MSFFRHKIKGEQVSEPNRLVESETLNRWRAAASALNEVETSTESSATSVRSGKQQREYSTRDFVLSEEVPPGAIRLSEDAALPTAGQYAQTRDAQTRDAQTRDAQTRDASARQISARELPNDRYTLSDSDNLLDAINETSVKASWGGSSSSTSAEPEIKNNWQPDLSAAARDFSEKFSLGDCDTSQDNDINLLQVAEEESTVSIEYYEPPPSVSAQNCSVEKVVTEAPKATTVLPADLTLNFAEDLKRRFGSNIRSALGTGTVIEGTFRFDSPVCVDGTLNGEVSSSSALIVGEQAQICARIHVGSLILEGTVHGDIEAEDLVEIRCGGILVGDVVTKRIVIEDGGIFQGNCTTKS